MCTQPLERVCVSFQVAARVAHTAELEKQLAAVEAGRAEQVAALSAQLDMANTTCEAAENRIRQLEAQSAAALAQVRHNPLDPL
eukprot:5615798-Pyramimonas_sp.AAC.2